MAVPDVGMKDTGRKIMEVGEESSSETNNCIYLGSEKHNFCFGFSDSKHSLTIA